MAHLAKWSGRVRLTMLPRQSVDLADTLMKSELTVSLNRV